MVWLKSPHFQLYAMWWSQTFPFPWKQTAVESTPLSAETGSKTSLPNTIPQHESEVKITVNLSLWNTLSNTTILWGMISIYSYQRCLLGGKKKNSQKVRNQSGCLCTVKIIMLVFYFSPFLSSIFSYSLGFTSLSVELSDPACSYSFGKSSSNPNPLFFFLYQRTY